MTEVTVSTRTVRVRTREDYGTPRVYPDCATGRLFARLTGKRTFSPQDLNAIRELGYTITMAAEAPRLPDGYGHVEQAV